MGMNTDQIYVANMEMEFADMGEKTVIFEPTGSKVYVLNELEREIFLLFDGANTVKDIENVLMERYQSDEIRPDFMEYLESLIEKGVLLEQL